MPDIFPEELYRDVPYITMIGTDKLCLEHHHGIISYQTNEIVFKTGCGHLTITGHELLIHKYTIAEAGVSGQIDSVLIREDGR